MSTNASVPSHTERIACPACGAEQVATVEHTWPWWTYVHTCTACGEVIMESEWDCVEPPEEGAPIAVGTITPRPEETLLGEGIAFHPTTGDPIPWRLTRYTCPVCQQPQHMMDLFERIVCGGICWTLREGTDHWCCPDCASAHPPF